MEWIDINERTPEPNVYVLINTKVGITIAQYDGAGRNWGRVEEPDEPLAYSFYNMQTELLNLDCNDRASFSIPERVTHWMELPERPNVIYKEPRKWTAEEAAAYHKRMIDGLIKKYGDKNYNLMMELIEKTTFPEDIKLSSPNS